MKTIFKDYLDIFLKYPKNEKKEKKDIIYYRNIKEEIMMMK